MNIHYVTGNKGKFEEAALILRLDDLAKQGIHIFHTPLHLDEIQGSARQIAAAKLAYAYAELADFCIIDDVSLYCNALNGLPGPYIRTFLETIGDAGLAKLISHYEDTTCSVQCTIAFIGPSDAPPHFFEGVVAGTIVPPRGTQKHTASSWNTIVIPENETRTFAEMSLEEMSHISPRFRALTNFRNYITKIHS
jgi:inosine triphosphate pyrophosphatase